jgi:hypothetical protein
MSIDKGHNLRGVGHECRLLQNEVVRGEDRYRGVRGASPDPVRGEEHTRASAAIRRLKEHPWSQRAGEFDVDVWRVIHSAHDDRPLRRDHPCHTVQRLSEQGVGSHKRDKLFRAFMPEEPPDQRPKPYAVPPGEDDGPGVTVMKAARGDPR